MATGMRAPPRAIDSVRADSARASVVLGPGMAVVICGASAKWRDSSLASLMTVSQDVGFSVPIILVARAWPVARIGTLGGPSRASAPER
ncbi:hypothetical protein D3C76_1490470 [compost metagenome]